MTTLPQPQSPEIPAAPRRLLVPKAPALVLDGLRLLCLTTDGEFTEMTADAARQMLRQHMPLVCHAPHIAAHLGMERFHAYDVLELFAFVHPGAFTVPTPRGIARRLNLLEPESGEDQCQSLRDIARHLLADLGATGAARGAEKPLQSANDITALAAMMGLLHGQADNAMTEASLAAAERYGWPWTPSVLAAMGRSDNAPTRGDIRAALRIWDKLPEWAVHAPEPPAGHDGVSAEEAQTRLKQLLGKQNRDGTPREERPQQQTYAQNLAHAFAPRHNPEAPNVVVAEAGTGVGKTLGYLAPATVWAEKNGGAVWVSTFTRNLQRQVEAELDRLYDDPVQRARKVVTRKGRENYLCLLNFEDIAQSQSIMTHDLNATALGLMARWVSVTADGDLAGRDFPGWLPGLIGWNRIMSFADRRGECIYAACPHFDKCFVEKSVRKAKRADIVIANHALVMHQTAVIGPEDILPSRYVFDEGHHLFEAADGAFSCHLDGTETADLRRWLLGSESGQKSRARGLQKRAEELIAGDDEAKAELESIIEAARALPGPGWRQRLWDGAPKGVCEQFLALCREQVKTRNAEANQNGIYGLETPLHPALPGLFEAAYALSLRLRDIQKPMQTLAKRLLERLDDEADSLDTSMRERLQFMATSLNRRAQHVLGGWVSMLDGLRAGAAEDVVDWLEITRADGHEYDVGFYRHALDPAALFAAKLKQHAQGVAITSATLRDITDDDAEGWQSPFARSGVGALAAAETVSSFHVPSPFDYAAQTRVLVIKDVKKDDADAVAAAFRELFKAAGGGALGIFTAVQRLKMTEQRLRAPLAAAGLPLYAQHVDPLETGTLIDIFREEENACLLGTDATRDGIDVPGRSLRLCVYDRVPWPRPTILHKARRAHFGRAYDDMLTRFKIKQAYGRLIRRADDRGVFVMLDSALPTRLTAAFPDGVTVERIGLAEAVATVRDFLREDTPKNT
ncbi:MAG TPA: ATP-dependent DNA helicase [Alphaproteobacteria bacterium]|mgnify:FL=1|nr:ATP-dependent DNA helicase [Alphaproteobacteria bacterium]